MTEEEFMDIARTYWGKPQLTVESDLLDDASDFDEEGIIEFLTMLQEHTGIEFNVDLDLHAPRIWSFQSILSGVWPKLAKRVYRRNYSPLKLGDIYDQVRRGY